MPSESNLLKIARVRDDQEFVQRIAAALMVQAQLEEVKTNPSPASLKLCEAVMGDARSIVDRILIYVASNPAVAAKIKYVGEAINTSDVTDDEIQSVIAAQWAKLAGLLVKLSVI